MSKPRRVLTESGVADITNRKPKGEQATIAPAGTGGRVALDGNDRTVQQTMQDIGEWHRCAAGFRWRALPWIGEIFHRRAISESLDWGPRLPRAKSLYSVCTICEKACGLSVDVVAGICKAIDGNPFHPSTTQPHARYSTPTSTARTWPQQHHPCPRAEHMLQPQHDPFRMTVPLKRSGPRGSGKWQAISWEDLVTELVTGGVLFPEAAGEENRQVDGLASIRTNARTPEGATSTHDLASDNSLAIVSDKFEGGRTDFLSRFAQSLGTTVLDASGPPWNKSRTCGVASVLGGTASTARPDHLNAEFVLKFGPDRGSSSSSAITRRVIVDQSEYHHSKRDGSIDVPQGGYGALALAMVCWLIENNGYDAEYLSIPNADAATRAGNPTFSNAAWLVVSEPGHPQYGAFLDPELAGIRSSRACSESKSLGGVVIDSRTSLPLESCASSRGELWPTGPLCTEPVIINGLACQTGIQVLYQTATSRSFAEHCVDVGMEPEKLALLAREYARGGRHSVADLECGPTLCSEGPDSCRTIMTLNLLVGNVDWIGGCAIGARGADCLGNADGAPYNLAVWPGMSPFETTKPAAKRGDAHSHLETLRQLESPDLDLACDGTFRRVHDWIRTDASHQVKMLLWHRYGVDSPIPAPGQWNEVPALQSLLKNLERIPLFVAVDTILSEISSYADYVIPDTSPLESWSFAETRPAAPTKSQGVRHPAVEPFTSSTTSGQTMCMEQLLIDLAKRLELPGFGENAFAEGGSLDSKDDYYLKMVANIAYDPNFTAWKNGEIATIGPVPNGNPDELKVIGNLRADNTRSLTSAQWHKVAYVLARGGRFENFEGAYLPNLASQACLTRIAQELITDSPKECTTNSYSITPAELRNLYLDAISFPMVPPANPSWMAHRFGASARALRLFDPALPALPQTQTKKRLDDNRLRSAQNGDMDFSMAEGDADSDSRDTLASDWNSFTKSASIASEMQLLKPVAENYIEMSPIDAARLGYAAGCRLLLWPTSLSADDGVAARLRVTGSIDKGAIAIAYGFMGQSKRVYALTERNGSCRHDLFRVRQLPESGPAASTAPQSPFGRTLTISDRS